MNDTPSRALKIDADPDLLEVSLEILLGARKRLGSRYSAVVWIGGIR